MTYEHDIDYGTPAKKTDKAVTVEIDGRTITVPEGTSVMRAAREGGVDIPSLCATDSIKEYGSCRLCLIEVDGVRGTPASCTTPVSEGMSVKTTSDRLTQLRRGIMELYISDHPDDDSPLHDMARLVGLEGNRYGKDGHNHLKTIIDDSNPYFSF